MQLFTKKDDRSELRKEYDNAVLRLKTFQPGTKQYLDQLEVVERLHTLLMGDEEQKKKVSPDGVLSVASNLIGIMAILKHEKLHNITSKALGFVTKGRVR